MRVVHFSTNDRAGGAARAAYQLFHNQKGCGVDAQMICQKKASLGSEANSTIHPQSVTFAIKRHIRWLQIQKCRDEYRNRAHGVELFSDDRSLDLNLPEQIKGANIVHLHWVADFVDVPTFFKRVPSRVPVVWTLHDMNPFTGGCHYDHGCKNWLRCCGQCPQICSSNSDDWSASIWKRRAKAYRKIKTFAVVGPSVWMTNLASASPMLSSARICNIPYGIDLTRFSPQDRLLARRRFEIHEEDQVVIFAASDVDNPRKGFNDACAAIKLLKEKVQCTVVTVGRCSPELHLPFERKDLGHLANDEILAMAFSAADICLIPSMQDNLPLTAIEALACGCKVVGYKVGGLEDIVVDAASGILVPRGDVEGMADACEIIFSNRERTNYNKRVSPDVHRYDAKIQTAAYLKLYEQLLSVSN